MLRVLPDFSRGTLGLLVSKRRLCSRRRCRWWGWRIALRSNGSLLTLSEQFDTLNLYIPSRVLNVGMCLVLVLTAFHLSLHIQFVAFVDVLTGKVCLRPPEDEVVPFRPFGNLTAVARLIRLVGRREAYVGNERTVLHRPHVGFCTDVSEECDSVDCHDFNEL